MSSTVRYPSYPNKELKIAATLNLPKNFDKSKKYAAVICNHPGGGVKEQTAAIYAKKLTDLGFVTLVPDATYQGESDGNPRGTEYAPQRVEDISCAVDYLMTQDFVDENRVGVLGICAGGAYSSAATMKDRRIKALGTVAAANFGHRQREGVFGTTGSGLKDLEAICARRTAEARGEEPLAVPLLPNDPDTVKGMGITEGDIFEAVDYYRTPRAQNSNSTNRMVYTSWQSLFVFDGFHLADHLLTQPLMVIVGGKPGSLGSYRDGYELFNKARSDDKSIHVVEGASHVDLYDKPEAVDEAISKLGPFFEKHL